MKKVIKIAKTLENAKKMHEMKGYQWFNPHIIAFHSLRIMSDILGGKYFISRSHRSKNYGDYVFNVHEFCWKTGKVKTISYDFLSTDQAYAYISKTVLNNGTFSDIEELTGILD